MRLPRKYLAKFVREIADQCMSSRTFRTSRGAFYQNYVDLGSSDLQNPAMFNKLFASIDDLESLLFSPVSLRFHIADPDIPNIVNEAKGRAAASKIRQSCRQSDGDSMISQAVNSGLIKGIGIIKQLYKDNKFENHLIPPEDFGVYRENHTRLDENMEAFCQCMLITPTQFLNLIAGRPDEEELKRKGKRYMKEATGGMNDPKNAASAMNIVIGGLYPLQAAGSGVNPGRGVVDWMSQPRANLDPQVEQSLMELMEVWIWDTDRDDWATFQIIGDEILILGRYSLVNALAYDPASQVSAPPLKGVHPYNTFCPNPVAGYFWGASEVAKLILLQEAINARIIGTNKLLRKQEEPPTKFVGSAGVNQIALSRYNKPAGYYVENSPNAKIDRDVITIPQDLWASLHEYERMFDELMGLPPVAKGHGEKGVRSANHAETLVRMFSPRFKDRALLIERDVEHFGALRLDLAKAHIDKKMIAWVPAAAAGPENLSTPEDQKILIPPAPGLVPVYFTFADLSDDIILTIDSHSSSPAFAAEAQALAFNLVKLGAMSPADLVERADVSDPDELIAGIERRDIAKAEAVKEQENVKLLLHSGGKK